MARKRASLQGRGTEILTGVRQDKPSETDAASGPQDSSSVNHSRNRSSEVVHVADGGQEPADSTALSPEWTALLQEEALSASGEGAPESSVGAAADLDLPPLATTPARPDTPVGEAAEELPAEADEMPEEIPTLDGELPPEPVELAEAPENVDSHVLDEMEGGSETGTETEPPPSDQAIGHATEPASMPPSAPPLVPPLGPALAPVVSGPATPPAPMHSESYASDSPGGAQMPAPKEKPEATDGDMRLKLGGLLYERATVKPSDKDLEPEGPEGHQMEIQESEGYAAGQPSRQRREPEILALVGKTQRDELWAETLELYTEVPDLLTGDANQSGALRLLQEAQDILMEEPRQFDVAKFKVGQVQSLVSWRRNVNRWSNTYGWGIFLYEIVWIVALVWGILGSKAVADRVLSFSGGEVAQGFVLGLWSTMMWGALGGVVGAFYSLYWHVAKVRDFDKQYSMWYVVQPVMGLLLGALVYLLIGAGFLTVQSGANGAEGFVALFFRFAVAFIAGFRQSFILEIIDRVIQVITPAPQPKVVEKEASNKEPPASG